MQRELDPGVRRDDSVGGGDQAAHRDRSAAVFGASIPELAISIEPPAIDRASAGQGAVVIGAR